MRFVRAVEFKLYYSPTFNHGSRVVALYTEIMLVLNTKISAKSHFRGWLEVLGCCL